MFKLQSPETDKLPNFHEVIETGETHDLECGTLHRLNKFETDEHLKVRYARKRIADKPLESSNVQASNVSSFEYGTSCERCLC